MSVINSVLGPLNTSDLGFTLMHEHILAASAGIPRDYPELLGDGFMDYIVSQLNQAKEGGIDSVVDASTLDLGRDVTVLAEASRQTGINIIACTGWYLETPRFLFGVRPDQFHKLPFGRPANPGFSADQFAQLFIREIQEGIADTRIKAGILKSASDMLGVTSGEETILRAVARAHLQTNIPIMLHSCAPLQVGKQQIAILKEEGVNMRRVKVDHSSDTADLEYLTWLLEQGCYLGMDRHPGRTVSPLGRFKTIKALIDAGYEDRLLLSHDWALVWTLDQVSGTRREDRHARNPDGYLYLKKVAWPELREMGVSQSTFDSLFTDNPRNFFDGN